PVRTLIHHPLPRGLVERRIINLPLQTSRTRSTLGSTLGSALRSSNPALHIQFSILSVIRIPAFLCFRKKFFEGIFLNWLVAHWLPHVTEFIFVIVPILQRLEYIVKKI